MIQAAIGVATINALLQENIERYNCNNVFEVLDIGANDTLGVIGDFGPLVNGKGKSAKKMYVFERNVKEGGKYYSDDSISKYLPQCDIVVITSTSIINKTFDEIIKYCNKARQVAKAEELKTLEIVLNRFILNYRGVFIMKNLFLTGEINIGKTTVLNSIKNKLNISDDSIGGFLTKAFLEDEKVKGFYIEPINYNIQKPEFKKRIIGFTPDGTRWAGNTEVFENFGVDILNYCLKSSFELIIMDELGFFESKAYTFQKKVYEIIESKKKVLGVIKPQRTIFMNSIKDRKDVIVVEITKQNRDYIFTELYNKIK